MKQDRVVTLTVLTFVVFGLISLFSQGSFIAPVPFIGEFTALLCIALVIEGIIQKSNWVDLLSVFLLGVTSLFASPFLFEVLMDHTQLNSIHASSFFDFMRLILEGVLLLSILRLITNIRHSILSIGLSIYIMLEGLMLVYPNMEIHFLVKGCLGLFLLIYHLIVAKKEANSLIEFALKGYGLLHLVAYISILIG